MSGYIMNLGAKRQRADWEKLELYVRYGAYVLEHHQVLG
jgi:hypothetical protein